MAYTTVPTVTDTPTTAANLNAYLRDNQLALKDPPSSNYEANEGSNFTITSGTFATISASWEFTFTTTGGDVLLSFSGSALTAQGNIDVDVDGVRIANSSAAGLSSIPSVATATVVSFCYIVTGLSAGSHTFTLKARKAFASSPVILAGAGTANYDVHPQFFAREIS